MFQNRFRELSFAVDSFVYTNWIDAVSVDAALEKFQSMIDGCQKRKGIVYVIGNGGSAGIASHFSNDLMKALRIPSQTLYDSNLMTCISNDIGYKSVFSYPLERLLRQEDLLVAISSSGKSDNILQAASVALSRRVPLITLSGFMSDNPLRKLGELNCWVDRSDYGLVETAHFFLLHTIIDLWNQTPLKGAEYVETSSESNPR